MPQLVACMQFFQQFAAEPSYAEAAIAADSHAYVTSSKAKFAPSATNATSAAVAFTHARMHPLAPLTATGTVGTGALRGVELYLTSTTFWYSPEGFGSAAEVVWKAQQQLQKGKGIQVIFVSRLHVYRCVFVGCVGPSFQTFQTCSMSQEPDVLYNNEIP